MRSTTVVTSFVLLGVLCVSCSAPGAEPSPTAMLTDSPVPTQPPPPANTPIPEPTSTPMAITNFEALAGKWTRNARGWVTSDGEVEWRFIIDENGDATVWAPGGGAIPYLSFENGLLSHSFLSEFGCSNPTGIYEVSGVPGEYMVFKVVDDSCQHSRHLRGLWIAAPEE